MIHCAQAIKSELEQELVEQPLQAIHCAPGATPIWFELSFPTIVPMVCVPWETLSQGTPCLQVLVGSYQFPM